MLFYKVVTNKLISSFWDFEQKKQIYRKDGLDAYRLKNGLKYSFQYVEDELFTEKELSNILGFTPENKPDFLKPVEVKKNNTHYFFGARFENNRPVYFYQDGSPYISKWDKYRKEA